MLSVSARDLLQRRFPRVRPPVDFQVILTFKRFSTRFTNKISDTCLKIRR